jgi:zinc/manganese transport system permease protein
VALALVTVWGALALDYQTNWPIGFFVGTISALAYALGRGWAAWRVWDDRRAASFKG